MGEPALKLVASDLLCNVCKEMKPLDAFRMDNRRSTRARGFRSYLCTACFEMRRPVFEVLPDDHPNLAEKKRECITCHQVKPLRVFRPSKHARGGRLNECRDCFNRWRRSARTTDNGDHVSSRARDYGRQHRQGVSPLLFRTIFESQHGLCAICSVEMEYGGKHTHLDHSHATGIIRGILCARCNHGIGHMRESVQFMRAAIAYLEKHGET